jgi:uncharacterized membrane protein
VITIPGKLYFAFAMVAVIVTAIGGYLLVEKPFMNMRKKYLLRPAPELVVTAPDVVAERAPAVVG